MGKAIFNHFKPWRNTTLLLLGLAILISGFAQVSQPLFDKVTRHVEVDTGSDLAASAPVVAPPSLLNTTSNYCAQLTTHFGGNPPPSAILLTIANLDANTIYVEIESATASPVDLLLVENIVGGTVSDPMMVSPGVIRRTVTWANPPTDVILNVLWSHEDFGGNWQLSPAPITVPFAATCGGPPPPASAYCAQPTTHFGGNPPSAILLTIANLDANSIFVEIESATASPVDLLLVENIVGGTVSDPMMPSPGVIRRTVTWANPPTDVILNVLWSHEDFGGNWQLSQAPITVPFAAVCDGTPPPSNQPTTNAPAPTCPASEVISIYGSAYPSIATNFDPNWGQSGHTQVNPNFDPGTGNVVLAYPNFNYQGTELVATNASSMEFFHVDVWTNASPTATTLQVSPINFGTGTPEFLVTIPFVQGEWTSVVLPKSAFAGMTWNDVRQLKFAANGPGSTNPVTIYLDNIFFSSTGCGTVIVNNPTTNAPQPTCPADKVISIYGSAYPSIATNFDPNWGQSGHTQVNPNFDPGTGNVVLAYPNFNYQGTELTPTNASDMEFFHVDVWTNASPTATTLRVTPINFGTGPAEVLVTIPFVQGEWTSVVLPKSAFAGMTWNDVRQLKFEAFGVRPVDIYLDNIYFSKCAEESAYCNTLVQHLGIPAETASAINLSIGNSGGNTLTVQIESATASAVDFLLVDAPGATISPVEEVAPGVLRSILSWVAPPTNVTLDVLWSKDNFGGIWRLNPNNITVPFAAVCETIEVLPIAPTTPSPDPVCEEGRVISLFSDAYNDVPVSTWLTPWSSATGGNVVSEAGNNVRLYQNVDFLGIETTGANLIDASGMNYFHIDIWTNNMTTFRVKLVDFGANGNFAGGDDTEFEIAFNNVPQRQWVRYDIPLSSFVGMNTSNIAQLILSGIPVGAGRLYIDNVYFSGCAQQDHIGCAAGSSVVRNEANGVYTITSTNCLYGSPYTKDQMAYASARMCGNGSITTQVTSLSGNGWAGITIREDGEQTAKKVQLMTNLNAFNRREVRQTAGAASFPQTFAAQGRYWLRLERVGNQIVGYTSFNGASWVNVLSITVPMSSCVEVGLVVTNASPNSTVVATFGNVAISGAASLLVGGNIPPLFQNNAPANNLLLAYPNPTTGQLTLDLSAFADQQATLLVQDAYGRSVRTEGLGTLTNATEQLDLSGLPAGVYYLRLQLKDSAEQVQRIVVQPRP